MNRISELSDNANISEKAIERYLVKRVKELGGIALKFSSHTEVGYPDRIVMLPGGITAWCELKSRGKKPRHIQEYAMRKLRAVGQRVYICDRRECVDSMIQELNYEPQ